MWEDSVAKTAPIKPQNTEGCEPYCPLQKCSSKACARTWGWIVKYSAGHRGGEKGDMAQKNWKTGLY